MTEDDDHVVKYSRIIQCEIQKDYKYGEKFIRNFSILAHTLHTLDTWTYGTVRYGFFVFGEVGEIL